VAAGTINRPSRSNASSRVTIPKDLVFRVDERNLHFSKAILCPDLFHA
jgi:hypothetical protein